MNIVQFEIVNDYPPNIKGIAKVFPDCMKPGVLFCWDRKIFNPAGIEIPDYLIAHENVHRHQQAGNPMTWWASYLNDPEFRLAQEVPAHQAEYEQFWKMFPNRNMRRVALRGIASRLSGPLYLNMISYTKARALIKAPTQEKINAGNR